MERRKVQTVGSGTYTVSLPKGWAKREGVAAGDVVSLHPHLGGELTLRVRNRDGDGGTRVAVDGDDPERVERAVRAAYASGRDAVTLDAEGTFSDRGRAALDRTVRSLTGVTVTDEADGRVTLRTALDGEEVSVRQSVRQLRFAALSMHRDATAALCGDEWRGAARGDQADRLYALVDRHFVRGLADLEAVDALGLTRSELFDLWATARELERVADVAERVGRVAAECDVPGADGTAEAVRVAGDRTRGVVEEAVDAVVGGTDASAARAALDRRDRAHAAVDDLDRRLAASGDSDPRFRRAVDGLRRTADRGGAVAELALRAAVRDGVADGGRGPADVADE